MFGFKENRVRFRLAIGWLCRLYEFDLECTLGSGRSVYRDFKVVSTQIYVRPAENQITVSPFSPEEGLVVRCAFPKGVEDLLGLGSARLGLSVFWGTRGRV